MRRLLLIPVLAALAGCTTIGAGGRPMRDPTGRALWSLLLPGAGQIANRDYLKGALMIAGTLIVHSGNPENREEEAGQVTVSLAIHAWSATDAYHVAQRLNIMEPTESGAGVGSVPSTEPEGPAWRDGRPRLAFLVDPVTGRLLVSAAFSF